MPVRRGRRAWKSSAPEGIRRTPSRATSGFRGVLEKRGERRLIPDEHQLRIGPAVDVHVFEVSRELRAGGRSRYARSIRPSYASRQEWMCTLAQPTSSPGRLSRKATSANSILHSGITFFRLGPHAIKVTYAGACRKARGGRHARAKSCVDLAAVIRCVSDIFQLVEIIRFHSKDIRSVPKVPLGRIAARSSSLLISKSMKILRHKDNSRRMSNGAPRSRRHRPWVPRSDPRIVSLHQFDVSKSGIA